MSEAMDEWPSLLPIQRNEAGYFRGFHSVITRGTNALFAAVILGVAMVGCNLVATGGTRLGDTGLTDGERVGNALIFVISEADVIDAVEQDERIVIKLSPDASARISGFASKNNGKSVEFVVGDIRILRVTMNAMVSSDVIRSEVLEESERARLLELLVNN